MKNNDHAHATCREETKAYDIQVNVSLCDILCHRYLECRMANGLMEQEDVSKFGLNDSIDLQGSLRAQEVIHVFPSIKHALHIGGL